MSASPQAVTVGLVQAVSLASMMEQEKQQNQLVQTQPVMSSLAGYVRQCWTYARDAKRQMIFPRLLQNVRARRGEYDPERLSAIRNEGGSEVYAMLTSVKCRAAASWIRDVMHGSGSEKPWTLRPSKVPELPPQMAEQIVQQAMQPLQEAIQSGMPMPQANVLTLVSALRDAAMEKLREQARQMAQRMEDKMEDQLLEGGWRTAISEFIDDITTYPSAVLKGPIVRRKPVMTWQPDATGAMQPTVATALKLEFARVDPFLIFPSPDAATVEDGYLIEKHRLSRQDLLDMIGVDGYSDAAIRSVLDDFGKGGLRDWTSNDMAEADAKGKSTVAVATNPDSLIDALQFWGSVQGRMLLDWGMDKAEIPDPTAEYHVEVWLIANQVIKATLNYDPLHRKPYYKTSYEEIPGSWWGNSVADLVRDSQVVMNAAARAMVNNMGIASGPQVEVVVDRLASGYDVTQMRPWQIWQTTTDPMSGAGGKSINFYQPDSRVSELMNVFQAWSDLADEYSGIPKFLGGDPTGNAGRTASGLSMLMSNAGKSIKQVIANIDTRILTAVLERLYFYNMRFSQDPELKGDINIQARGANALIAKEAAQQRRNEFMAATANPIDMQIIGMQGRAALLREAVKTLDMDPDNVVPSPDIMAAKQALQSFMQAMQPQMPPGAQGGPQGAQGAGSPGMPAGPGAQGAPGVPALPPMASQPNPTINGQVLTNGAPITDLHSPSS